MSLQQNWVGLRKGCDKPLDIWNRLEVVPWAGLFTGTIPHRDNHTFPSENHTLKQLAFADCRSALNSNWFRLDHLGKDSRLRFATLKFIQIIYSEISPDMDLFEASIIARRNTEHNQDKQKALLKMGKARGTINAIRKDHHRVYQKDRAPKTEGLQVRDLVCAF